MITNANELNVALEQLAGFADLLEGMRLHAEKHQSRRFPITSTAYIHRIRQINAEIRDYLQTPQSQFELPDAAAQAAQPA